MDRTAWAKRKLCDCVSFRTGKLNSNAATKDGPYPFFTCSQEVYKTDSWAFDTECVLLGGNNASAIYPIFYFKGKFNAYQRTYVIESKDNNQIRFFYYLISKKLDELKKKSTGAATRFLTLRIFDNIDVLIPRPEIQAKIVSVLSAYDDLIENNEKRIKILEEMAQRLYTEWFVKFRFPGHEKTRMVPVETHRDASLQKIPEGWEVKRFGEIMSFVRGRSYSSEQISDIEGEYYIVNLKSFNRGGGFRFDGAKYYTGPVNVDQFLKQGDVVVAVTDMTNDRAVIARPARVPRIPSQKTTLSADAVKMVSEKIPSSFIYYSLLDHRFTEATKHKANGANVLHLKPAAILEYRTVIPPVNLLNEFESKCKGILGLIDVCLERNRSLTKTRDLLIPQLVTGKREVKGAKV